jgi:allophanate hydrolase
VEFTLVRDNKFSVARTDPGSGLREVPMNPSSRAATVRSLTAALRQGRLDPLTVADEVICQLEQHRANPIWIETVPSEAIRERARWLSDVPAEARSKLPLYAIPFAVKDNMDVAGMGTSAGCPQFSRRANTTASVVQRLQDAGAMLIGKTNMDQFATGLTGMRSPYGSPINPYSPDHIPGGSSSGSAVAVAAGITTFSLGTDTAGSGRVPASFNGVVGFKPSKGLLSTSGVIPACRTLDCVSIFAKSAADARAVFAAAVAFDPADPYSRRYAPAARDLDPPRIGVLSGDEKARLTDKSAVAAYERALLRLEALGLPVVEIDFEPFRQAAHMLYFGPWMAERLAALGEFIASSPGADYIQVVKSSIVDAERYSAVDAFNAMYRLKALARETEKTWESVSFVCLPTTPTIYTRAEVEKDPARTSSDLGSYTNFANLLDLTAISVPNGHREDGLPTGIMFVGPTFSDASLLDLAEMFA